MEPRGLSEPVKNLLVCREEEVFVSAISAFELGIKVQKGKLKLPLAVGLWFKNTVTLHDLKELEINSEIASRSTELPLIHFDPFDRILVSTAQIHDLTLLTPDKFIRQYDVKTKW